MVYKKYERHIPMCLECGDKIRYGRTDKKFCCEECKTAHYNRLARRSRYVKRRVISALSRNYMILEELVREGRESVDILELVEYGFIPNLVTSVSRVRRSLEYSCFDIRYVMTESRIHSIMKKSLPLQAGTKITD